MEEKAESPKKKGGWNLVMLGVISVMIAIVTTSISLLVYHNSGDIYLDRSRPGYLPDEKEIEDEGTKNLEYELDKSGKMTMEILEEYLENLEVDIQEIDLYGKPFEQKPLSDGQLGIPTE